MTVKITWPSLPVVRRPQEGGCPRMGCGTDGSGTSGGVCRQ